jgi:two-component system sensor histidine kinase PilS (NtrC family)
MQGGATRPPWTVDPSDPTPDDSAFYRLWRGFMTARVVIAFALVILLGALWSLGPARGVNGWLVGLCGTYLAAALTVRALTRPLPPEQGFDPQWVSTIGIDLLAFATLQFLNAAGINYLPLFALPVLTAGVLGSPLLALGTAAAVTLLLLGDAWIWALQQQSDEYTSRFLQAGLTGIGYFAVALLANQLAVRLAREERESRRSRLAARTQAQVNELVVEQLGDGVLVVGSGGRVLTANPAARRLLGCENEPAESISLSARPTWQPLLGLALSTLEENTPQLDEVALQLPGGERLHLRARTRLTPPHEAQAGRLCVMFLEDLRELEARLRTEKLAAMGRMSAAVAHEIRNPLAAITQANALLGEELAEPSQRQLSAMVQQNARRLSHIVEEILDLARVQQNGQAPSWLTLDEAVAATSAEWAQQAQATDRLQVAMAARNTRIAFHAEHLRRVLVNLLDNALRYAGRHADSIRIATQVDGMGAWLRVWSDGVPLEQGVQRHLFEPFFSSESRSSGLGLYICRELCERHGATIGYRRTAAQPGGREGNEFFVHFPLHQSASGAAPFDTMAV